MIFKIPESRFAPLLLTTHWMYSYGSNKLMSLKCYQMLNKMYRKFKLVLYYTFICDKIFNLK